MSWCGEASDPLRDPVRLQSLLRLGLDGGAEPSFDRLARLGARLLDAPLCIVSLIDGDRHLLPGAAGLPPDLDAVREAPLRESPCLMVFRSAAPLAIADGRTDPRMAGSQALEHGYVSYLGVPLFGPRGVVLGAFCVFDRVRRDWTAEEIGLLGEMAASVGAELHLRMALRDEQHQREVVERELRRRLDELPVPVFETDAAGRLSWVSAGCCALVGCSFDELIRGGWQPHVHDADVARVGAALAGALASGQQVDVEFRLRSDGPEERWVLAQGVPRYDASGRMVGSCGTCIDVTEGKRTHAEMLEVERRLREAQRLESLAELAGGIAHDFNNVLTGILGNCELARLRLPVEAPEQELLGAVLQAGQRATDLCKRMLAYSGHGRFHPQWFDLSTVVADHRSTLGLCMPPGVQLSFELEPGLPAVHGDPTQIAQVLLNLVINAAEAVAATGGGTIRVRTGRVHVDDGWRAGARIDGSKRGGDHSLIEVVDEGPGIAPEVLDRLFEPFVSTKGSGRGLGLAAVQGIVRGHGGLLHVASQPGRGARFSVALPAEASVAIAPPAAEPEFEPTGDLHGTTVLVVDDDDDVRALIGRTLRRFGGRVFEARDAATAARLFGSNPRAIDVALVDQTMPGKNGAELILGMLEVDPGARILMMSGYEEDSEAVRRVRDRIVGFVSKPFLPETLVHAIGNALPPAPAADAGLATARRG